MTTTSPGPTVGVDLGGTKLLGALVGEAKGDEVPVLAERRVPTPHGAEAIVDAVVGLWDELSVTDPKPVALGIGAPGLVDRSGRLRFAPNLPGVSELELGPLMRSRVGGVPVAVENDATCAGWGERTHGAGRGADDVVVVTLGTGIGGGIVSGGRLLLGASGFAGEVGHMVVDPAGPECPCGKRGCWERFASGSGLGWLARQEALSGRARRVVELAGGDIDAVRGEDVTTAAAEGDADARAVIDTFGWWLAVGLANLTNIFDPGIIVIGGGLIEAGELLLAPARAAFHGLVEGADHRPPVPIVAAQLGERAGAIGAAGRAAMLLGP